MSAELVQTGTEGSYPPVEVASDPGSTPVPAGNKSPYVTDYVLEGPSEAVEGEIVDDTKERVQNLITQMHKVGKRYPFNLLQARWRLSPIAWAAIKRYHNPQTVWLSPGGPDGQHMWGIPVHLDREVLDGPWQFELVCRGIH